VGYLKGVCHASFSTIRKYFRDVLKIPISRGQLAKVIRKVSESLEPAYKELDFLVRTQNRLRRRPGAIARGVVLRKEGFYE